MNTFQLIALGIFSALILLGIGVFATQGGLGSSGSVGEVVVWGTVDSDLMEGTIATLREKDRKTFEQVSYKYVDPKTYASELINAMASGTGPDLFLLTQDQIVSFNDKILPIPFAALSQQEFNDAYVDEARLLLTPQGMLGLPFMLDPLVMYWNRDLFANAGVARPPQYWNDFLDIAPKMTTLAGNAAIKTSTIALGEWSNILYAKDILATLIMQAGDAIVVRSDKGVPTPVLGTVAGNGQENGAASALQFYTEFANPTKTIYTWNRALPNSQSAFVGGDLAVYLGYASDYPTIAQRNPNLPFSVALLPQIQGNTVRMTFGRMTSVAVARTTKNPEGALVVAQQLTSTTGVAELAKRSSLPPVRRDVSIDTSGNAAAQMFVQSALIARGWLDPDPTTTNQVFSDMIQSVVSGKQQPTGAVFNALQMLQTILGTNTVRIQ